MSKHAVRKLIFVALTSAIFIAGCIPIEDIRQAWDLGIVDPSLEGSWQDVEEGSRRELNFVSFSLQGDHYRMTVRNSDPSMGRDTMYLVKTLKAGNHLYLVVDTTQSSPDQIEGVQGGLLYYYFDGDRLVRQDLNMQAVEAAFADVEGVRFNRDERALNSVVITRFSDKLIDSLAGLPERHEALIGRRTEYQRVTDVEALIAERVALLAPKEEKHSVIVDMPSMVEVAKRPAPLLRHLKASPEWKVVRQGGCMVAYRKQRQGGEWKLGSNGYCTTEPKLDDSDPEALFRQLEAGLKPDPFPRVSTRTKLRFGQEIELLRNHGYKLDRLLRVQPDAGLVTLRIEHNSMQGISSFIAIESGDLELEIFEESKDAARVHTQEAIDELNIFFAKVLEAEAEIEASGHAAGLLEAGSVERGQQRGELKHQWAADGQLQLDLQAWLNPGESGSVHVCLADANLPDKVYFSQDAQNNSASEYVGWSTHPDDLFSFACSLFSYEPKVAAMESPLVQVWFRPDAEEQAGGYNGDGEPLASARLLLEAPLPPFRSPRVPGDGLQERSGNFRP